MGLSFGEDQGPIKVYGLLAEHHCEVKVDGEVYGVLYGGKEVYEYRGKRELGKHAVMWVASSDKRVVVARLTESLDAERLEKKKAQVLDGQQRDASKYRRGNPWSERGSAQAAGKRDAEAGKRGDAAGGA